MLTRHGEPWGERNEGGIKKAARKMDVARSRGEDELRRKAMT
jgi:hypothetical protein